tara:strand:+ start:254 stop:2167 length:1914 start_codon:yes stop_codon:yes gene_type:complete
MKDFLLNLPRNIKRLILIFVDIASLSFAAYLAFVIRAGSFFDPYNGYAITNITPDELLLVISLAPIIAVPVLIYFRLYRSITRYISSETFTKIAYALIISGVAWSSILIYLGFPIPRLIYPTYILFSISFVCYTRFTARNYLMSRALGATKNVLIYSIDNEAKALFQHLSNHIKYNVVGFITSDSKLERSVFSNTPIININNIDSIVEKKNIKEILIPDIYQKSGELRNIIKNLHSHKKIIRKIPSIENIVTGKANISDFKKIDIKDLLGRETVKSDSYLLKSCIENKTVLVTGAGGSIGSELARQIISLKPKLLILFEQSEYFLYKIENEIKSNKQIDGSKLKIYLGSVSDKKYTEYVFSSNKVDTVYHAAACKHVPLIESNPLSAITTNILGSYYVAKSAIKNNVKNFIFVSSDKAVRPTNIMGSTKRFAEITLQSLQDNILKYNKNSKIKFCIVRFGNVLDTSGSVIPLFREQISKGGPLTVTHPDIIRYFMTIEEAVELVIQAGSLSDGGEIYILDMGEPIKVLELAKEMIKLSGNNIRENNSVDGIEIIFTGLRPGEKMYEELFINDEKRNTLHKDIVCAIESKLSYDKVIEYIDTFENLKLNILHKELQSLLSESINCDDNKKNIIDINKK